MRIGMVLQDFFPPDIRVEKEARALSACGHEVNLLALQRSNSKEVAEERVDDVVVSRIKQTETRRVGPFERVVGYLVRMVSHIDSTWEKWIWDFVINRHVEVLHVHDLPLAVTGIAVARKAKIPVVIDLHENYPASVRLRLKEKKRFRDALSAATFRWERCERKAVVSASRVVVVVDEALERLVNTYGVKSPRVYVVMNVEDEAHFQFLGVDEGITSRYLGRFVVCYVGGGGRHRGLDIAVEAIAKLSTRIPEIMLVIVGPDGDERQRLETLGRNFGLSDRVEIVGWQPFEKVKSYILASDVCLVPHRRSAHTDTTIPHKLFQYMLLGKPVVVSDCRPLERIVRETGSGLVFRSEDTDQLAEQTWRLYKDREMRAECGARGRQAVAEKYNWSVESVKLCGLYEELSAAERASVRL